MHNKIIFLLINPFFLNWQFDFKFRYLKISNKQISISIKRWLIVLQSIRTIFSLNIWKSAGKKCPGDLQYKAPETACFGMQNRILVNKKLHRLNHVLITTFVAHLRLVFNYRIKYYLINFTNKLSCKLQKIANSNDSHEWEKNEIKFCLFS